MVCIKLVYVTKSDLTSKKFVIYNMAGGFDGMGVTLPAQPTQARKA